MLWVELDVLETLIQTLKGVYSTTFAEGQKIQFFFKSPSLKILRIVVFITFTKIVEKCCGET